MIVILARNFADDKYLSISERKIANPDKIIRNKLIKTTFDNIDRVLISVLFNFLSLLKKVKSISEIKADPMPNITLITCKIVASTFVLSKKSTNSILFLCKSF